jgi:hypothetical protein
MRAIAVAALLVLASAAQAATWSIQLSVGFSEEKVPDDHLAQLRAKKGTVSVDAQAYSSGDVALLRVTWLLKLDEPVTRSALERLDQQLAVDMGAHGTNLAGARSWKGQQLIGTSTEDVGDVHVTQRRLYALAGDQVIHILAVTCFGPRDDLTACEATQRTMQITLPNPTAVPTRAEVKGEPWSLGYKVAAAALLALVVGLVAWVIESARRGTRRRRRS